MEEAGGLPADKETSMSREIGLPKPSLRRLPLYYRYLKELAEKNVGITSSEELGTAVNVPAAQVRKDLTFLGELGRPGVGYEVLSLAAHLEDILGIINDKEAVLVGAGRLGTALAGYEGFRHYGLDIVALFDTDQDKVGKSIGEKIVFPLTKLPNLVQRLNIQLGIITVPASAAQSIADLMVAAGVTVIWNFAPIHLKVGDNIWVENEDLAARLAMLSYHITQKKIRQLAEAQPLA
jgi:redox-sensing transcriptional repressor